MYVDAQFVVVFMVLALFIYSIIPWNCTECYICTKKENFTQSIQPSLGCPKGGNLIDDYNMCSSQTSVPDATNNCPNGFNRVKNYCSKGPYQPELVCPTGYQLKTKNGIKFCKN